MFSTRAPTSSSKVFTLKKNQIKKSVSNPPKASQKNELWVELFGGLGNTLFQLATGYAIAKDHDYKFSALLPINNPHKTTDYSKIYKNITFSTPPPNSVKIKEQCEQQYKPPKLANGPIILSGYWQCPKYFDKYKESIIKLFGFEIPVEKIPNSVALHVRRGDYLKFSQVHPLCSAEYYKKAVEIIGDSKTYYIFSDDIEWCKNNFEFIPNKYFVDKNEIKSFNEMLRCENFIIANSSFSWWAAYLARPKKVIAPAKWIKTLDSDIYCDDWIII